MATPTLAEIREEATAQYMADKEREQGTDFTASRPEDRELREDGYFVRAQRNLMRRRGEGSGIRRRGPRLASVSRSAPLPTPQPQAPRTTIYSSDLPTFPLTGYRGTPSAAKREPVIVREQPAPKLYIERVAEREQTAKFVSSADVEAQRRRGETREEAQRRLEAEARQQPPPPGQPSAVPSAPTPPKVSPAPRPPPRGASFFGRVAGARKARYERELAEARQARYLGRYAPPKRVKRVPDIGPLFARFQTYPTSEGKASAQSFRIYPQLTVNGRRFYRIRFGGTTIAPVFDSKDEAVNYITGLKEFTEPEYAAKKDGMVAADSKFIRENLIRSRQSPAFVPVFDDTGPTPRRLRA